MTRFLFVFGYESPQERRANDDGSDLESMHAVWIRAVSENEAMMKGRAYANAYVAQHYLGADAPAPPLSWSEQNFAHWISANPLKDFSALILETFDEI